MQLSTRKIVHAALVGALYAVFTIGIAPFSYGPIQFRVAEIFKVMVLFDPVYAFGIGIGTFFGNLASPFVGPWELIFMPLSDMLGGVATYYFYKILRKRYPLLPLVFYALTTSASVGLMLTALDVGGFWVLAGSVAVSEIVILAAGYPIIQSIVRTLRARGIDVEH